MASNTAVMVVRLVGLYSGVQGFRTFHSTSHDFFLKDVLGLSPLAQQLIRYSAKLPEVAQPIYGVVSDAVYIRGGHRLPYIAIGVLLEACSWALIAILPKTFMTNLNFFMIYVVGIFGASVAGVANEAIITEAGRKFKPGHLQSLAWIIDSCGGILGGFLGGIASDHFSYNVIFLIFVLVLAVQFLITNAIMEESLGLSQSAVSFASSSRIFAPRRLHRRQFLLSTELALSVPRKTSSISCYSRILMQFRELSIALQRSEVFYLICWFTIFDAIMPNLEANMFYYQTEVLKINSSVYALSSVFRQLSIIALSLMYNNWLRRINPRNLLSSLQYVIIMFIFSDVLFLKGCYRNIGVSDPIYIVLVSSFLDALYVFKGLPYSVLIAELCPEGCEGSVMAFVASISSLSLIFSAYVGVLFSYVIGISTNDCSKLACGKLLEASLATLPLFCCSWIPMIELSIT